jgi:hypothetical protein
VVRGVVTTADGRPIVGADVHVEGTVRGAVSDSAGRFVIGDVAPGDVRLRARVIGYAPSVTLVAVAPGDTSRASLSLAPSTLSLQEVTVTGSAARSERRVRRTGAARSATPVVGCWAVHGGTDASRATRGALPARLDLREDGRALARGAAVDAGPTRAPGRWTLDDDGVLRVRWDERFTFELRAGDDGAWAGTAQRAGAPGVRVTLDADAGCTP